MKIKTSGIDLLGAALLGAALLLSLLPGCTGKAKSADDTINASGITLARATQRINDRCPEWVDADSRLDSVVLSSDGHLYYYYSLPSREKATINPTSFQAFLLPGIIENIHYNPDLKMHRDSSVTILFNYRDRNGEFITEFSVGPEMYQ